MALGYVAASNHLAQKALEALGPLPASVRPTRHSPGKRRRSKRQPGFESGEVNELDQQVRLIADRDSRLDAAISRVAERFEAKPQRIRKIVFSFGDLEVEVGSVLALEFDLEQRIGERDAAKGIQAVLRKLDWPFGDETSDAQRFALSRFGIEVVLGQTKKVAKAAEREMKQLAQRREKLGFYRTRDSTSFQKMPVIRKLAVALCDYLARSELSRQYRVDGTPPFRSDPGFPMIWDELRKREKGEIYQACADLLHIAFPTFTRLTKDRIAAALAVVFRQNSFASEKPF